ncbi:DUF1014-domain-containing protein [Aulographum hederae CBS 113979]|uniref:DUF1014-domain-containing protein n=1 Tax=Aulographum hederae CBS 113979 TaxID=1176131 RepID=A0A6G1HGQ3_9PEZI|nr:DUF1014-domain-containing protein [Aulographum hederae CBS 113979]
MPKKVAGENSKKAAGNAKKAEAAAQKQSAKDQKLAKEEDAEWSKGAKDSKKAQAAAEKSAEAARKKAEKEALLKEEEASLPQKAGPSKTKKAEKKNVGRAPGLDLSQLDSDTSTTAKSTALNATGIDNALDALSLTNASANEQIDRHPERRFKAAYAAYEERRLEEMRDEKGLRRNQKVDAIRKEFEKSPDNPFNQVAGKYNSSKDEMKEIREGVKEGVEKRLGGQAA